MPLPPYVRREQEFKHITVVVNQLTKMRHFIATVTLEDEKLTDCFVEKVYYLHSLPVTIVSDRGMQFISTL
jgi:hypothetical protein